MKRITLGVLAVGLCAAAGEAGPGRFTPWNPDLQGAARAVRTVWGARGAFVPGPVWTVRAPRGEVELKGAILAGGLVLADVRLSPVDGEVLPRGYRVRSDRLQVSEERAQHGLAEAVRGLVVLGGAEYREPEAAWAVPLTYGNRIVAHVKVSADGGTLLQDHRVADEVRRFGR
jgi:hypothetical protein